MRSFYSFFVLTEQREDSTGSPSPSDSGPMLCTVVPTMHMDVSEQTAAAEQQQQKEEEIQDKETEEEIDDVEVVEEEQPVLLVDPQARASSYEDIYKETTFVPEQDESHVLTDATEVGDKFDTKHDDLHLSAHKTSSFENVYVETQKEAACVDEKDVDEFEKVTQEVEADYERPEKGVCEDEKEGKVEDDSSEQLEDAEKYDSFDTTSIAVAGTVQALSEPISIPGREPEQFEEEEHSVPHSTPSPKTTSPLQVYASPIDKTYESGLDQVGQEGTVPSESGETEALERSFSCEEDNDFEPEVPRQRHYSSPEDLLLATEPVVSDEKTGLAAEEIKEDQSVEDIQEEPEDPLSSDEQIAEAHGPASSEEHLDDFAPVIIPELEATQAEPVESQTEELPVESAEGTMEAEHLSEPEAEQEAPEHISEDQEDPQPAEGQPELDKGTPIPLSSHL